MSTANLIQNHGPITRQALRHKIASVLMTEIFQGDLPAGSRLVVMKLADRFDVSSTPVRESLMELESVGLVQFVHNRGAVVKPFGPEQLRQIYHLRRILESEAARSACGSIDRPALEDLHFEIMALGRDFDEENWATREMASDRRLHEMITSSCGSSRLSDEIRRYNTLVQTGREIVGNQRKAQERAIGEHLAIIECLLNCDPEGAARQMARHIESTARLVDTVMFNKN